MDSSDRPIFETVSTVDSRPWWHRRRWWLLVWLACLPVIAGVAFFRSGQSTVVIYNDSGLPVSGAVLSVCSRQYVVDRILPETSVRVSLDRDGGDCDLVFATTEKPVLEWRGGYVEPRSGYRVELRIRPDFSISYDAQISIWRRFL